MRKIVLQMITTLNGRLDRPDQWVTNVSDELDSEFNRVCETFDTVLLGHKTYGEMAGYWPNAETDPNQSESNRSLAYKLNTYKKYVFSNGSEQKPLEWNNAELVLTNSDQNITNFINNLKAQPGKDIHLAGGARLAQSLIGLGLVDEFHFFVYPVVSEGLAWFDYLKDKLDLELLSTAPYEHGIVGLNYRSKIANSTS
jgi:dihydrofolate reductase